MHGLWGHNSKQDSREPPRSSFGETNSDRRSWGLNFYFLIHMMFLINNLLLSLSLPQLPDEIVPANPNLFLAKIIGRHTDDNENEEDD